MPIKPENRARYPNNWRDISLRIRARAKNRCEWCDAENGKPHPKTGSHVVLTVAHLDHMPENCSDGNLRALCQRCHLRHDNEGLQRKHKELAAMLPLFSKEGGNHE